MPDKKTSADREKRQLPGPDKDEEQIIRDFKALKKQGWSGSSLRMNLARKWKRPIVEVNEITGQTDKLEEKRALALQAQEAADLERRRIEALGQHGFVPDKVMSGIYCGWCGEHEFSSRHELFQERLI